MTNAFALPRLLPISDHDKDVEILALHHQITVLQRQLARARPGWVLTVLHRLPPTPEPREGPIATPATHTITDVGAIPPLRIGRP
jgi:putative transposase